MEPELRQAWSQATETLLPHLRCHLAKAQCHQLGQCRWHLQLTLPGLPEQTNLAGLHPQPGSSHPKSELHILDPAGKPFPALIWQLLQLTFAASDAENPPGTKAGHRGAKPLDSHELYGCSCCSLLSWVCHWCCGGLLAEFTKLFRSLAGPNLFRAG